MYCSVATRVMSLASALTSRSICMRLICGVLSFTSSMLGSSSGIGCASFASASLRWQLLLQIAHERDVLLEQRLVARAELGGDARQIVAHVVEHAHEAVAVLHPAVELAEHLVRIVDRRDGLVRARRSSCASRGRRGPARRRRTPASQSACASPAGSGGSF